MNLIFVPCDTCDTVTAGQCPYCRLCIPFPTIARGALPERVVVLNLEIVAVRLPAHRLHSLWAGHCGTPRGPKALSVFAAHAALAAVGVLLLRAWPVHRPYH